MKIGDLGPAWSKLRWFAISRSGKGLSAATLYQAATYLVPLLTFPYLARVLGVEGFGLAGLAMAVVGYALMITDWAFGLTATQAVAQNPGNAVAINRIIWSTVLARFCLGSICAVVIAIGGIFAPAALRPVLWASMLSILGLVFNIDWALRGIHATASFALISIVGRASTIPLIFVLVRGPGDADMALLSIGLGGLLTTTLGLWRGVRLGILGRPRLDLGDAWRVIKDGGHVFSSIAMTSLYTNTVTAGLGLVGGAIQVGLFSAADRIKRPFSGLLSPISMVYFPRMVELTVTDPVAAERLARRLLLIQSGAALLITLALIAAAPLLVHILLGEGFMQALPVLRVQAWLVFLVAVSNVLGMMVMLPFGMKREFTLCILSGAVTGLIALFPLAHFHGAMGASIAACLAELSVTTTMAIAVGRRFTWIRWGRARYA